MLTCIRSIFLISTLDLKICMWYTEFELELESTIQALKEDFDTRVSKHKLFTHACCYNKLINYLYIKHLRWPTNSTSLAQMCYITPLIKTCIRILELCMRVEFLLTFYSNVANM